MRDKFISDYAEAFSRIQDVTGCGTQQELAVFFGVKQSSISDAKKRKNIPDSWFLALLRKLSVNPDWVRCGTGAKYFAPVGCEQSGPHVVRVTEVRPPQECTAQDLVNELVRRALQQPDIETLKEEVASSWLPVHEASVKS